MNGQDARAVIEALALSPHPEGGWFRETWRADPGEGGRARGTAILFLLEANQRSHWHRVDGDEYWFWHGGAPLALSVAVEGAMTRHIRLGMDIAAGERPQALVPAHAWQAASPVNGWTLVGCTVVPGFEFAGFDLAPAGWSPPR
ncbi:cupin domain-containing protein [Sphingobium sp. AN558]|uniref:cupin domain-containing protein n=1 Tax=Sphingobium sp. AN558 TaxID=3133442 RepID=UPI0030BBD9D1